MDSYLSTRHGTVAIIYTEKNQGKKIQNDQPTSPNPNPK